MIPLIEVRSVHHAYGNIAVVKGVSLAVKERQTTVVIGPSGSGKSTLLRLVAGLEEPAAGQVLLLGKPIAGPGRAEGRPRAEIGMVFQSFELFPHLTAMENVMLAPMLVQKRRRREAREIALEYLAQVGLTDKANAFPQQLSGGQQQRIAIARALAMTPRVILFDEPTSSLDPQLTREVLDVMLKLVIGGLTAVVVTHEMAFARQVAEQVVFMEDGFIVETGSVALWSGPREEKTTRFLEGIALGPSSKVTGPAPKAY